MRVRRSVVPSRSLGDLHVRVQNWGVVGKRPRSYEANHHWIYARAGRTYLHAPFFAEFIRLLPQMPGARRTLSATPIALRVAHSQAAHDLDRMSDQSDG